MQEICRISGIAVHLVHTTSATTHNSCMLFWLSPPPLPAAPPPLDVEPRFLSSLSFFFTLSKALQMKRGEKRGNRKMRTSNSSDNDLGTSIQYRNATIYYSTYRAQDVFRYFLLPMFIFCIRTRVCCTPINNKLSYIIAVWHLAYVYLCWHRKIERNYPKEEFEVRIGLNRICHVQLTNSVRFIKKPCEHFLWCSSDRPKISW